MLRKNKKVHERVMQSLQNSKASAVLRVLHQSVVLKGELLRNTKLSMFHLIFVPIQLMATSLG